MIIVNNGASPVTLALRDGTFYRIESGKNVTIPDAKSTMLDDSAFIVGLVNAGTLTLLQDSGSAWVGFPSSPVTSDAPTLDYVAVDQAGALKNRRTLAPVSGDGRPYAYVGPWAGRPNAALYPGYVAFITDVGFGVVVASNGSRWTATGPVSLPGLNGGAATKSDLNTDWFPAWSATLPAGFMGPSGRVVLTPVVTFPNSATTKNIQVLANGTVQVFSKSRTTSTGESPYVEILNRGEVDKQLCPYSGTATFQTGGTSVTVSTGTINTDTTPLSLVLQVSWGTAGAGSNNISVESCPAVYYPR